MKMKNFLGNIFFSFEQFSILHNNVVGGPCSKEPHEGA